MKKIFYAALLMLFAFANTTLLAQQKADTSSCPFDCCRPDGHAPFGIMTDHVHGKGKFNIAYNFMSMMMKGNQTGTSKLTDADMMMNYAMSPTTMTMQMHMLMFGYGITSKFTLMAMLNYNMNTMNMNMNTAMGMHMVMSSGDTSSTMKSMSSGLGDTKLYGLYDVWNNKSQRIIASVGLNIPTGNISVTGMTILGDNMKLPYCMQLGTGSFAIIPGLTYTGQSKHISWGAVAYDDIKTGANKQGYKYGNEFKGSGWLSYKCCKWISASARMEYTNIGSIKGYDPDIAMMMNNDNTANTANYGGTYTNLHLGLNFYVPKGTCKELRFGAEYLLPLNQNLNGTQMTLQSGFIAGVQYLFM